MDHQDWTPVVLRKNTDNAKTAVSQRKPKKTRNLESDDPDAPKTLGISAGKQIQQARCAKNMTQKELAQKLNIKPAVIQSYETGKVVPDNATLNKIARMLGIKIQR